MKKLGIILSLLKKGIFRARLAIHRIFFFFFYLNATASRGNNGKLYNSSLHSGYLIQQ